MTSLSPQDSEELGPSLGSTTFTRAIPLGGGRCVRLCVVPYLASGPSPDTQFHGSSMGPVHNPPGHAGTEPPICRGSGVNPGRRSPANRGWGWGWTPDPRQIGGGGGDGPPISGKSGVGVGVHGPPIPGKSGAGVGVGIGGSVPCNPLSHSRSPWAPRKGLLMHVPPGGS